jgi:hypothetical protein
MGRYGLFCPFHIVLPKCFDNFFMLGKDLGISFPEEPGDPPPHEEPLIDIPIRISQIGTPRQIDNVGVKIEIEDKP